MFRSPARTFKNVWQHTHLGPGKHGRYPPDVCGELIDRLPLRLESLSLSTDEAVAEASGPLEGNVISVCVYTRLAYVTVVPRDSPIGVAARTPFIADLTGIKT